MLLLLVGGHAADRDLGFLDLAKAIGRGLRAIFRGAVAGGDAAARTAAKTHSDWREHRDARAEARDRRRCDRRDEQLSGGRGGTSNRPSPSPRRRTSTPRSSTPRPPKRRSPRIGNEQVELKNYDSEDAVAVVDEGERAHAGLTPMGSKRA